MAKLKLKGSSSEINKILNGDADNARGPAKGIGGLTQMDENPESRQKEGSNKSESSDITKEVKKTTNVPGSPESTNVQGYGVVNRVDRTKKADSPEAARRSNNLARDARTVLGRCTPSTPTFT